MKHSDRFGLVLVKMKSYVLFLALLQFLGCSGIPPQTPELEAMADKALVAAMAQVNSLYATSRLYRATQGSVTRVVPTGLNTVDLMMVFQIKETDCTKASGSDPQTCPFRSGFFVPSSSCSGRVRMFPTSAQVISVKCGKTSSSSSESSEELLRGSHFNIPSLSKVLALAPAPTPAPPPPPVQPSRSLHIQAVDVQHRGDTFNNNLE